VVHDPSISQLEEHLQKLQDSVAVGGAQNKDLTQANRELGKMNKQTETETLAETEKIETLQRRNAVIEHGIAHVRNETLSRNDSLSLGAMIHKRH
jgi:hypothetical protein